MEIKKSLTDYEWYPADLLTKSASFRESTGIKLRPKKNRWIASAKEEELSKKHRLYRVVNSAEVIANNQLHQPDTFG